MDTYGMQRTVRNIGILTAILCFVGFPDAGMDILTGNSYVKLEVKLSRETAKPGGSGEIRITFAPVEGIHVNADPPVEFRFDSTSEVVLQGTPRLVVDKRTGYLSTAAQVKQGFLVPRTVKPGTQQLKGVITYYYCSDTEGWCTKFTQPVELSLTIIKQP